MRELDPWCHFIPIFFCLLSVIVVALLYFFESLFEQKEENRRQFRYRMRQAGQMNRYTKRVKISHNDEEDDGSRLNNIAEIGRFLLPIVQQLKDQIEENKKREDAERA